MSNSVTFLGTGTSQGVPVILCKCEVCQSNNFKDKRYRSSIWVQYAGLDIIIDTGPDFRSQILSHTPPKIDAVLYTHGHKDHIAGMDDIRAYTHLSDKPMDIYLDEETEQNLRREYHYVFSDFKYPGIPEVQLHRIEKDKIIRINEVKIQPIQVLHYKLQVFGFRFGNFTYLTDANFIPKDQWGYLEGTEILVINALRRTKHISHFTLEEAIEIAEKLKVKKAYFTHISHFLGLHEEVSKELPSNMFLAYDGLSIQI